MMKNDMLKMEYIKVLERKLEKARMSYEIAKNDTIEAEGRMVTRYDSTKTETAWLADGYLKEVKELENMINRLQLNITAANIGDAVEVSVFENGEYIESKILRLDMVFCRSERDVFLKLLGVSVNDVADFEIKGRRMQYHVKRIEKENGFDGVCLGSFVCLEDEDEEKEYYYLVNGLGGMEINVDGTDIFCISKQTPIANMLLGRNVGDAVDINSEFTYRIISIENARSV